MVKCISGFYFPEEVQDLPLPINTTDLEGGQGEGGKKKTQKALVKLSGCSWQKNSSLNLANIEGVWFSNEEQRLHGS